MYILYLYKCSLELKVNWPLQRNCISEVLRVFPHLIALWHLTPLCRTHGHFFIGVIGLGEIRARGGRGRGCSALQVLFIHLLSFVRVLLVLRPVLCVDTFPLQMPLCFLFWGNHSFPRTIDAILKIKTTHIKTDIEAVLKSALITLFGGKSLYLVQWQIFSLRVKLHVCVTVCGLVLWWRGASVCVLAAGSVQ